MILFLMPLEKDIAQNLQCKKALTPNGKYISVDDGTPKIVLNL